MAQFGFKRSSAFQNLGRQSAITPTEPEPAPEQNEDDLPKDNSDNRGRTHPAKEPGPWDINNGYFYPKCGHRTCIARARIRRKLHRKHAEKVRPIRRQLEGERRRHSTHTKTTNLVTPKSTSLSTVSAEVLKGKPSNSKEFRDQARNQERWNKPRKPNGKKPEEDCRNAWNKLTKKEQSYLQSF